MLFLVAIWRPHLAIGRRSQCFQMLLMTGYSQEAITRLGNRESLGPLIEKPFTVDGLLDHVRSVLDG